MEVREAVKVGRGVQVSFTVGVRVGVLLAGNKASGTGDDVTDGIDCGEGVWVAGTWVCGVVLTEVQAV